MRKITPRDPDPTAAARSPAPARSSTYVAPALEKGFNVIELLAHNPAGLMASEIATGLGLTMSEIFRIIVVMERRRWLSKGADDKYRVTPMVLDLVFRATPAEELTAVAAPHMRDFAAATDQSCHLVVRNGEAGLIIMRQQNPGATGFHVRIGTSLNLATTCSGHVLLAFQTEAAPAESWPRSLRAQLNAVRARGFERMESARTLGVTDISYPIFGFRGEAVAALTVPFLKVIDGTQLVGQDEAQNRLRDTTARITEALGGKTP